MKGIGSIGSVVSFVKLVVFSPLILFSWEFWLSWEELTLGQRREGPIKALSQKAWDTGMTYVLNNGLFPHEMKKVRTTSFITVTVLVMAVVLFTPGTTPLLIAQVVSGLIIMWIIALSSDFFLRKKIAAL